MKKIVIDIPNEILIRDYLELNSSYKVAKKYNTSATAVKRILKELGVLRTQNEAASIRNKTTLKGKVGKYKRTEEHKKNLSDLGKTRTAENNPFFGKQHSEETKKKIGESSKKRTGKRNPNYKDGKYIRRPRDFKYKHIAKLRNKIFNRDNYICCYCSSKGGHLHAHHILPYWVRPEAFLDEKNLITVCSSCHFTKAHLSDWTKFDIELVTDYLKIEYSLNGERLNELATFKYEKK